jgi:hypothetical protein
MLFYCVAALTGVSTICIDPTGGDRYASVIEPLTALGPDHVASFMHQFCLNLAGTIRDRLTEARANWKRLLERLDQPEALRDLPQHVHVLYLAGALFALGVIESWREDGQELEYADRLDSFKLQLYELSADQLQMMHYGNRGHLQLFEKYRERVERHAIQRGTAWQVETWTFSQLLNIYLRWGYVAGLKECTEQLKRLSAEIPTLLAVAENASETVSEYTERPRFTSERPKISARRSACPSHRCHPTSKRFWRRFRRFGVAPLTSQPNFPGVEWSNGGSNSTEYTTLTKRRCCSFRPSIPIPQRFQSMTLSSGFLASSLEAAQVVARAWHESTGRLPRLNPSIAAIWSGDGCDRAPFKPAA